MEIQRVNSYTDPRFSKEVLAQHGAFLVEGSPISLRVISKSEALISGQAAYFPAAIKEFRFYAGHICTFYDEKGGLVAEYPPVELFDVALEEIQPSQFYVDREKVEQVVSFIHSGEDVVIPLLSYEGRWLSLDGHSRMYAAQRLGIKKVKGFFSEAGDYIFAFAKEAQQRGIHTPMDLELLEHDDYCIKWHKFCDDFFAEQ